MGHGGNKYTGCFARNPSYFARKFLGLKYIDTTKIPTSEIKWFLR
jgi:hypothetical protein